MQKGKSLAIVTQMPSTAITEAKRYVNKQSAEDFSFWGKLKDKEQAVFSEEHCQLATAMMVNGASELAIGERLYNINALLAPHNLFSKYLRSFRGNFTVRTANRYINAYVNAKEYLPELVLKSAMAKGLSILGYSEESFLGRYTEAYRQLGPPPRNPDPEIAKGYVEDLETTRKEIIKKKNLDRKSGKTTKAAENSFKRDPEELKRIAYRAFKNAFRLLPSRQKGRFLESFVGMCLTEANISNGKMFEPEAIPEDFRQGRGRPRLVPELETTGHEPRLAKVI